MVAENHMQKSTTSTEFTLTSVEKPEATSTPKEDEAEAEAEDDFPTDWRKIALIMTALFISMFLVALDRTILGTAIPSITDDFHSIDDVGWYASAYLISASGFQLIYARIYNFYPAKWVLLWAILIFEVGSAVCGAAPNSKAFIVGRAIAGLGGAGIFGGTINIMVSTIPLHKRPMYQGMFGAIFGVASICGPLVGGAFTSHLSWRWCFYINLPIGAIVVLVIVLIFHSRPSKDTQTTRERIMRLDPYGTLVFLPGVICLLLALQWGGATYAWSNARIIALFVLAAMLLTIFILIQFKMGENATVPVRILNQRSILAAAYFSFTNPGAMFIMLYFLPLWFQAIKGNTAVESGINTLPMVISLVFAAITGGALTQRTGYYVPQAIACSIIACIGGGLITTLKTTTGSPQYIGYQIVFGFGLGLGMQQAGMAAQTCLGKKDVTTGVSVMFFMQGLGGSLWISIAQVIFSNRLVHYLSANETHLDPGMILHVGAIELAKMVPKDVLPIVLTAYNHALSDTFILAVGCSAVSIFGSLALEWKSVKGLKQGGPQIEKKQMKTDTEDRDVELGKHAGARRSLEEEDVKDVKA